MDLPVVSLSLGTLPPAPPPAPCPGRHADGPARGDAPADARTDGPGDAPADGPGDARADARADGAGDAPGAALAVVPDPGMPRPGPARVAWLTAVHWAAAWWAAACRAVVNPRGPYHAQPESLAAHDAYRRSRSWVPAGQSGRVLGPAGAAYHHTLARFGLATGYAWAWVWARPMRLLITAAVLGTVLGFWLG